MKKETKPGDMFNAFQKKKKNWIAGAVKNPGALHRELGVKAGNKISATKLAAAAKKGGKEGKRAHLAQTLKSFHKKKSVKKKLDPMAYGTKSMSQRNVMQNAMNKSGSQAPSSSMSTKGTLLGSRTTPQSMNIGTTSQTTPMKLGKKRKSKR